MGSRRTILARFAGNLVLLKLIGGRDALEDESLRRDIEASIERASDIRAGHPSFARLLGYRWTEDGVVTINEYLPDAVPANKAAVASLQDAALMGLRLCDALGHIHTHRSSHGDIHPDNVLIGDSHAYLVDFDLADYFPELVRSHYVGFGNMDRTARALEDVRHLEEIAVLLVRRVRASSRWRSTAAIRLGTAIQAWSSETSPQTRLLNLARTLQGLE